MVCSRDNWITRWFARHFAPKNRYKEGEISESKQKSEGFVPSLPLAQPSSSANVSLRHSDTEPKEESLESKPKEDENEAKLLPQASPSADPLVEPKESDEPKK